MLKKIYIYIYIYIYIELNASVLYVVLTYSQLAKDITIKITYFLIEKIHTEENYNELH